MTPNPELIVASFKIHKSLGSDGRRDPVRTAAAIADTGADILVLQEDDMRFGNRAGLLDLDTLRQDLGRIAVSIKSVGGTQGFHDNLLLVRNALAEVVRRLILPGLKPRGALMADLQVAVQPLGSRARQTRVLMAKLATTCVHPALLMDDLSQGQSDAPSLPGPVAAARSFLALFPWFALDRMLSRSLGNLSDRMAQGTLMSRVASDHRPIRARLLLPQARAALAS